MENDKNSKYNNHLDNLSESDDDDFEAEEPFRQEIQKKELPKRENRGRRMKALEGRELELEEGIYNALFFEASSDEDFNPDAISEEIPNEDSFDSDFGKTEDDDSEFVKKKPKKRKPKKKKEKEEEIIDVYEMNLSDIDEAERKKDEGVNEEEIKPVEVVMKREARENKKTKPVRSNKFIEEDEDELIHNKRRREKTQKLKKFLEKKKKHEKMEKIDDPNVIIIEKWRLRENDEDDLLVYNDEDFEISQEIPKKEQKPARKPAVEKEKPTQKDLLYEAIFTEIYNIKSLEDMQRIEEMNKREQIYSSKKLLNDFVKIIRTYKDIDGIKNEKNENLKTEIDQNNINLEENKDVNANNNTVVSDNNNKLNTFLRFTNVDIYQKIFDNFNYNPQTIKEQPKSVISGEPAKYFDPLTKSYYNNIAEFKLIREQYFQKEEDNLLFRIQTLSDLASQKKEKLKKLVFSSTFNQNNSGNLINIVNKYNILKSDAAETDRKPVHRKFFLFNFSFRSSI